MGIGKSEYIPERTPGLNGGCNKLILVVGDGLVGSEGVSPSFPPHWKPSAETQVSDLIRILRYFGVDDAIGSAHRCIGVKQATMDVTLVLATASSILSDRKLHLATECYRVLIRARISGFHLG